MKVDISHPSATARNYWLTLRPETGNDEVLLHFLRQDSSSPFDVNEDGDVVVIVPEKESTSVKEPVLFEGNVYRNAKGKLTPRKKRNITPAGMKAIRTAQKKRWAKFRKLGKTPLTKKKGSKKKKVTTVQKNSRLVYRKNVGKAQKSYWNQFTPTQRKEINRLRRVKGEANKQARLNPKPVLITEAPFGVTT